MLFLILVQFYIITMVFHNQLENIQPVITNLNRELSYLNLDNLCIHTGPIIRKEEIYTEMPVQERRRIFNKMGAFIRQTNIQYKCFHIEKKHIIDVVEATGKLSKQISQFIRDNYEEFLSFDEVKLYYDNGQIEVSKMLTSIFNVSLLHFCILYDRHGFPLPGNPFYILAESYIEYTLPPHLPYKFCYHTANTFHARLPAKDSA